MNNQEQELLTNAEQETLASETHVHFSPMGDTIVFTVVLKNTPIKTFLVKRKFLKLVLKRENKGD